LQPEELLPQQPPAILRQKAEAPKNAPGRFLTLRGQMAETIELFVQPLALLCRKAAIALKLLLDALASLRREPLQQPASLLGWQASQSV